MKGLIVTANHTVQLVDDIPMPEIGPYEALVRIDCCIDLQRHGHGGSCAASCQKRQNTR